MGKKESRSEGSGNHWYLLFLMLMGIGFFFAIIIGLQNAVYHDKPFYETLNDYSILINAIAVIIGILLSRFV